MQWSIATACRSGAFTTGESHDNRLAAKLLSRLKSGPMLLADRGYDADWIRTLVRQHRAWANIPPRSNRKEALSFSPHLYRARNLIDRFLTRSSTFGLWRPVTTSLRSTTLHSSNLHRSDYGSALMSPLPSLPGTSACADSDHPFFKIRAMFLERIAVRVSDETAMASIERSADLIKS
jgi:transposase